MLTACGEKGTTEVPNAKVSGTVTLDGHPMPQGTIEFGHPEAPSRLTLTIKDGKFSGEAPIGECAVRIANGSEAAENTIPAKWNDESGLTANVQKDESANTFHYKITSK